MSDTIAAIATGQQISAIGIIRLSGDDAIIIADKVFTPSYGGSLHNAEDRKLIYGGLRGTDGETIDICLCTISRAPNSYTGENTAEFQCHGSPVVLREALESLFAAGARQAGPGEFTKRAFINGRMDLTQSEAVIDLISAETALGAKNAVGQLGGAILRKADAVYDDVVNIISHFHAVLDYPDEDIEPFALEDYSQRLDSASRQLQTLLDSFDRGRIMQQGIGAVILGRPNAGKSSLMNALLGYERAIVTDIPGTTRDTIVEKVKLGGVLLRITDTAGLRGTDDPVEKLGVDRALDAAEAADLALAVFDGSEPLTEADIAGIDAAKKVKNSIAIINKCDLEQKIDEAELLDSFDRVCKISAINSQGLDELGEVISEMYPEADNTAIGEILTNARQAEVVKRALEALNSARESMNLGLTPDVVLTEAEAALGAIGELTGKTIREDVTARIFERFCVGK